MIDCSRRSVPDVLSRAGLMARPDVNEEKVQHLEKQLGVQLQGAVREVLLNFGHEQGGPLELLSFEEVEKERDRLVSINPEFSPVLVPIFRLEPNKIACSVGRAEGSGITDWVVMVSAEKAQWLGITSGEEALLERLDEVIDDVYFSRGLVQLAAHVLELNKHERYRYSRKEGKGELPHHRYWRPYRFCIQDVIIAATVIRYQPDGNFMEVDVFLAADIPELEPLAGARALARFLLGEAVACGTDMEIRFRASVEGGRVPVALRQVAAGLNVTLGAARPDRVSPSEAVQLSLALAGLSLKARHRLQELSAEGVLAADRICYAIHEGSWSPEEAEILLAAPHPDRILADGASKWQRVRRIEDLQYARAAVMCGRLLNAVSQPERQRTAETGNHDAPTACEADEVEATEDAAIPLDVSIEPQHVGLTVGTPGNIGTNELQVGWTIDSCAFSTPCLNVLLRPLSVAELPSALPSDLRTSVRWCDSRGNGSPAVLVPNDFRLLPAAEQKQLAAEARRLGVALLVTPDRLADIDEEVTRRIRRMSARMKT